MSKIADVIEHRGRRKGAPDPLLKNLDAALSTPELTGSFRNPLEAPLMKVLPSKKTYCNSGSRFLDAGFWNRKQEQTMPSKKL
jgi:hypothetical protein